MLKWRMDFDGSDAGFAGRGLLRDVFVLGHVGFGGRAGGDVIVGREDLEGGCGRGGEEDSFGWRFGDNGSSFVDLDGRRHGHSSHGGEIAPLVDLKAFDWTRHQRAWGLSLIEHSSMKCKS